MIPVIPELNTTQNTKSYYDKTYIFDLESDYPRLKVKEIIGGIPAIRQTVFFILNTERYKYPIYSWNYGVELMSLFGKPMGVVIPELSRRIKDALTTDDRINDVTNFAFDKKGRTLTAYFVVYTKYGELPVETEVTV